MMPDKPSDSRTKSKNPLFSSPAALGEALSRRININTFLEPSELQALLNAFHDPIIGIDNNGCISIFNSAAERITRRIGTGVLGLPVDAVFPDSRLVDVLQSGEPELNGQVALAQGTFICNRLPIRNGQEQIVGAVAVFRDVSEIKQLAAEVTSLKEIQTLLEAIINCTDDAISVVDNQGMQIMINPAYSRMTGFEAPDVLNRPATIDIADGESVHMQVLRTGKPVRNAILRIRPNRKEVTVNAAPIVVNDRLRGSVAVMHDISEIRHLLEELEGAKRLVRQLKSQYSFDDIVGQSETIKATISQAKKAAMTPATVLLRGESGTGKELFAHAIHRTSDRSRKPFIRVNCAAISESLLESELFGYVEGAFTGAKRGGRTGFFEEANEGTIFLDEIGEIGPNLQAKLLRVLQEKEIVRVGDTKPVRIDVRVIAATNANLEKLIKKKVFREDLYYRLNVVPIVVPPLRERRVDIPLLANHIIRKLNQEYGRSVERLSREGENTLLGYDWPGNVREMENLLGRALINMKPSEIVIEAQHLPRISGKSQQPAEAVPETATNPYEGQTFDQLQAAWERDLLAELLKLHSGNKTAVARALQISIRGLYYKLEKHDMA